MADNEFISGKYALRLTCSHPDCKAVEVRGGGRGLHGHRHLKYLPSSAIYTGTSRATCIAKAKKDGWTTTGEVTCGNH